MTGAIPLSALHTFVQVARHGSMKRAAEALCVSPGAVSQQIRNLEDRLTVQLFTRTTGRDITLTNSGRILFDQVVHGFAEIEKAWAEMQGKHHQAVRLTVTTTASFASTWLVPRLHLFKAEHPEIEITIDSSAELVDLRRGYVDVAIRHGLGNYPGHDTVPLWSPELWPVCSPRLLESGTPIVSPVDCLSYPLLQDVDRADWTLWLRAHGIEDVRAQRGTSFSEDTLLIKAAAAGQGIALVRDVYAKDEVDAGRLVRVLREPWPTQFSYYAVYSSDRRDEWKITAFCEWLQREMQTA